MSSSNLRLVRPRRGGKGRRWTRVHKARAPSWAPSCGRPFCGWNTGRARARCGGRMKAGGAGRRGEHSEVPRQHGRRKEAATPSEGWEQGEGVGRGVPACRRAGVQRALRATRPSHQGSVWSVVSHMHAPTPASAMRVSAGALLPIQLACAGPRPWCERVGAGARWRPGFEFNTRTSHALQHTRSAGRLQNQRRYGQRAQ